MSNGGPREDKVLLISPLRVQIAVVGCCINPLFIAGCYSMCIVHCPRGVVAGQRATTPNPCDLVSPTMGLCGPSVAGFSVVYFENQKYIV